MWTSPGTWPSQLLWNKKGPKGPFFCRCTLKFLTNIKDLKLDIKVVNFYLQLSSHNEVIVSIRPSRYCE